MEDRIATLERQMARLLEDRSIGSAKDGKFSLKWPARVQGPNGDAYILVRQVGGLISSVPAAEFSNDQWHDGAYWDDKPVGTIWPYSGAEADIPTGWFICDGANGTHDLRDKFILGGSLDEVGTEAGAQSTVIAGHTISVGNHVDDVTSSNASGGTDTVTDDGANQKTVNIATHQHLVSLNLSHTLGGSQAHTVSTDYFPPYYTLAFIQKVS